MLRFTRLSKIAALLIGLLVGANSYAQIGIGTTSPNTNSLLELNSTAVNPGGLRLPRVALTNTTAFAPLSAHVQGMFVYNISTAGDVTPGVYYNTGTAWVRTNSTTPTNDWSLTGNAGTVNATNFLGTTTAGRELNIRTANINRMRVQADGLVTVNRAGLGAFAGDQFSAFTTNGSANNGYATSGGTGVYGQTNNGIGVYGIAGANGDGTWGVALSGGDGVYGEATSSNGVWGDATTGIGVRGQSISSRGVLGISTSQTGVQGQSTTGRGVEGNGSTFGTIGFATGGGVGAQGQAITGDGVRGISTAGGRGVYGQATTANGVHGYSTSGGNGVFGQTTSSNGVWGQASTGMGVRGQSTSNRGVLGISDNSVGVQGESTSTIGVVGIGITYGTSGTAQNGVGAQGESTTGIGVGGLSDSGVGVVGESTSGIGVFGLTDTNAYAAGRFTNSGALGHGLIAAGNGQLPTVINASGAGITGTGVEIGIFGVANDSAGDGIIGVGNGIAGFYTAPGGSGVVANSDNIGVYAYTTTTTSDGILAEGGTDPGSAGVIGFGDVGVAGIAANLGGIGVLAVGDFDGTGAKYFHIDHPLDPANKYLNHASIESNEILNLYRGTEVFDGSGRAIVTMPNYYDAININASYQLTAIGGAMPNLYIEKEIANGQFIIAGGIAGKKVSWQLTAERNDPYMQKYPEKRIMEIDKGEKRGTYLMPELFGKSKEQSYFYKSKPGTVAKTNGRGIFNQTSKSENKTVKLTAAEGVKTEKALESKENTSVEIEKTDAAIELKKSKTPVENTDDEAVTKKLKTKESSTSEKE